MTITMQLVLRALLTAPGREVYGLEVVRATGLPSGTVYPILSRLEGAGWLEKRTEDIDPRKAERPKRHYYKLTGQGIKEAREAMVRAAVQLAALGAAFDAPGSAAPLSIGGIEVGITVDERQPPGTVGIVSRDRDGVPVSAFSLGAEVPEPEEAREPGPCEHRRPPGSYCARCGRLIGGLRLGLMGFPLDPPAQVLLVALQPVSRWTWGGRTPNVGTGEAFWSNSREAPGLIAAGQAVLAPEGTVAPPAEPPHTVHGSPGFGAGTSNSSPG
jgi:DNA-binding MarR family transcriptional regulator